MVNDSWDAVGSSSTADADDEMVVCDFPPVVEDDPSRIGFDIHNACFHESGVVVSDVGIRDGEPFAPFGFADDFVGAVKDEVVRLIGNPHDVDVFVSGFESLNRRDACVPRAENDCSLCHYG